jgi:hypothetical protein
MVAVANRVTHCPPAVPGRRIDELCARVLGEFREMPGLTLTLPQAARLFSIDPPQCEQILDSLVQAGELATNGRAFGCANAGRRCV